MAGMGTDEARTVSGSPTVSTPVYDAALGLPAPGLRRLVTRYAGYRYLGLSPGTHLGLPSRSLTVVVALGPPTHLSGMPDPAQAAGSFRALASGLATRPAEIRHDGNQYGVQLDLTPLGSRALLGLPAGELGPAVVDLVDLLGVDTDELVHRMATATRWVDRFAVLDEVLGRRAGRLAAPAAPLVGAWHEVVTSGGSIRVDELAASVGWSRRHLTERFRREYGLGPKELARIVRFERSKLALQRPAPPYGKRSLADVAAACGYFDQAHLCREWVALAGCPPSTWLRSEELPSVQAASGGAEDPLLS